MELQPLFDAWTSLKDATYELTVALALTVPAATLIYIWVTGKLED